MDKETIKLNEVFFELLCVAIGNRKSLSITPSAKQWAELFALSKKHALVAVAFHGLSLLKDSMSGDTGFGSSIGIDEMAYLKWLGLTAKVAQKNKDLNAECSKVCKDLVHDGFKTMVLKGQSNLDYYPESMQECRTAGDIDVWVRPFEGINIAVGNDKGADYATYYGKSAVVEYARMCARMKGVSEDLTIRFHHVDMPLVDVDSASLSTVEVEAHFMPMYLNNPFLNKRLQSFFEKRGEPVESLLAEGLTIPVGTVSFNVIYQLTHIYKHLFEEGIGLRQLMDYYFVLRALHIEQGELSDRTPSMAQWAEGMGISVISKEEICHVLKRCGLFGLAGAVMYVLREAFAMPSEYMICEPDEKRGQHLLDEIMQAGNFGKYDPRKGNLSNETSLHKFIRKTKHNLVLAKYYPQEALWEPPFRLYHWVWRKLELWRY